MLQAFIQFYGHIPQFQEGKHVSTPPGASLTGGVCAIPAKPHKNTKLNSSKPQSRGVCARPAPRLKQTTLTYNVKRKRVTVLRDDETDCDEVSLY